MSTQSKIDELIGCGNANAVNFAKQAAELKTLVESRAISRAEYEELVSDLKRIKNIAESSDDLAIKSAVHEVLIGLENTALALL
jgi:hypothetical protein